MAREYNKTLICKRSFFLLKLFDISAFLKGVTVTGKITNQESVHADSVIDARV